MARLHGFEDLQNLRLVRRVIDAVQDPGPVPSYHHKIMSDVFRQWPMLARALEALLREYQMPILKFKLNAAWFTGLAPVTLEYDDLRELMDAHDCLWANTRRTRGRGIGSLLPPQISLEVTHVGYMEKGQWPIRSR
jgi:hypothetical protein